MKMLWCWRCKMEVPMLDEEEYAEAYRLYGEGMQNIRNGGTRQEWQKTLLDFYKRVTGWDETEPNAIMHHRIAQYGLPCETVVSHTEHQKHLFAQHVAIGRKLDRRNVESIPYSCNPR